MNALRDLFFCLTRLQCPNVLIAPEIQTHTDSRKGDHEEQKCRTASFAAAKHLRQHTTLTLHGHDRNNPLLTEAIGVYFLDMDVRIHEQVVYNEDGSFTILINSRIGNAAQMDAYRHAIAHIMNHDFEKSDADEIELLAHES